MGTRDGSCGDPVQACAAVKATLIRHATLRVEFAGLTLLVDPQLDPAGPREAVPGTPNPRRSPLVGLPEPAEAIVEGLDALLVTHLHGSSPCTSRRSRTARRPGRTCAAG